MLASSFSLVRVDLGRQGIELDLQARGRLVDKIDGFVRKEAVGDVAVAQGRGGDDRGILDADPVMDLISLLDPTQDRDGILRRGFVHHHGLEAALEGGVFLDVFAILVERRRTDRAEFAAGELGFQHVRGVDRSFARAGSDDGVELVDEKNDLAIAAGHLLEEGLEPVLEFATVFRARDHRADVHGDEAFVLE